MFSGVLALTSAAPAFAQPAPVSEATKDAARNSYRAAEMKLKEGNYALALQYYSQAESILPVPATKYKIALCHDRLGHAADALKWYQAFLDSGPPPKMADFVTDARARILALGQSVVGQIRVAVTPYNAPRLSVSVDGGPPQSVATALRASPGRHRLVVQADGFNPTVIDVDVTPGGVRDVPVQLVPGAVAQVPVGPQPVRTRRSNVPSYVLFGVTGVGAILGGVFGGLALGAKSSFNKHPFGDTTDANNEQTYARVSDASFGVAIVAGVTGLVLILTNRPQPVAGSVSPLGHRAFVTPYAGPNGGGLTGGLSF
jgi:hypothetical protein